MSRPTRQLARRQPLHWRLHRPALQGAVQHLAPEVLHRAIQRKGLEQCVGLRPACDPLASYLAGSLAPRRFSLVLLSVFGAAALVLALAGLYAVISHSLSQRAREIAIRMALGATPRDIHLLVLRQGMRPAALGVLLALPVALGATRTLGTMLFGVAATDVRTYLEVALVLLGVAVLAGAVPATRAGRSRALPTDE